MTTASPLNLEFQRIRNEAIEQAGALPDIPRRASVLMSIYDDSGRNHAFSLIAAHGAMWGASYFDRGGKIARLMGYRYFYNRTERAFRLDLLESFATAFREVNRQVCIDTYANYHFTKRFGEEPGAAELVPTSLLAELCGIHAAARNRESLPAADLRRAFVESFRVEQEATVAPGVQRAVAQFDCPILRTLILRPIVRFPFFPRMKYLCFKDFSNAAERIAKGHVVFDLAARAGWDRVRACIDSR